jgi:phospholipid/cholesterol/gamma-HCH transport system substrate-binding protein
MAIAAMTILAVLIWLLTSTNPIWQRRATLHTYMRDAAAVAPGAPVRLNGIPIGSVEEVELTDSQDPARYVRITMEVEQARLRSIPVDSIAGISSQNVLGAKEINISRGRSPQTVSPNAELPSEPSAEIQDLVRKGSGLFDAGEVILNRIEKIVAQVESGKGSVGKFLVDDEFYNRLTATIAEFQKISSAISSGRGTVGRLLYDEALYNEVRSTIQRLDTMVAELQAGQGTAGKLLKDPALYDETRASISQMRRILDDINAGKGTAGKLLKDEQAYRQIQEVLTKFGTTLDRVNSGEGTIGQLLANQQLYDSMVGLTSEMRSLVKDVRADPRKFLRIKLALF